MEILSVRHAWPEDSNFTINRPNGRNYYIFLHFWNSVKIRIDGKYITTEPNTCIIWDKFYPQWFQSEVSLIHNWIHFDGIDVLEFFELCNIKPNHLYTVKEPTLITELVRKMEKEYTSNMHLGSIYCDVLLRELFINLSRFAHTGNQVEYKNQKVLDEFSKMRLIVFSSLDKDWTVKKMADLVNLSESRFYSIYKSIYGLSPIKDLIKARIELAQQYLLDDNHTIEEIAFLTGYKNIIHFYRQFKSVTKMTPQEYVRAHIV
ncbi:MAG: helix-turn-helix transcriptional regulator [Clostridiaceae bacterium]|nr:helix-turn-helix transcriptional regulator [Clostridiaceae bacterium]